jgi:hypothetical protein
MGVVVVEILFIVVMLLWFLSSLPVPQISQYPWASGWLAFIAVLLLGVFIFMPGLR